MGFLRNFEITKIIGSIERILNAFSYSSMGKRIKNKIKKQSKSLQNEMQKLKMQNESKDTKITSELF